MFSAETKAAFHGSSSNLIPSLVTPASATFIIVSNPPQKHFQHFQLEGPGESVGSWTDGDSESVSSWAQLTPVGYS